MKPDKTFNMEVLPAPDGPKMAVNRPELNSPQASCKIFLSAKESKYVFRL